MSLPMKSCISAQHDDLRNEELLPTPGHSTSINQKKRLEKRTFEIRVEEHKFEQQRAYA